MVRISVIGVGYVGLIQASGLAKLGHNVTCVDIDSEKVEKINKKEPPIYEDGLQELLAEIVPDKLTATTDISSAIKNSEITFICVGTPARKRGSMSLLYLQQACEQIGAILKDKKDHLIVIKSTIVPGTTEEHVIPILEKISGKKHGDDFSVIMNPEFLKEGTALADFFKPDRIIIGSTQKKALDKLENIYKDLNVPILKTSFRESEMIKYASNSFLATKISFINELGNICKLMDIDTNIIAKGMGMDRRISPHFLQSGIGFGGSCFPKDIQALIYRGTEHGYYPRLLRSVLDINRDQPHKVLEILENYGNVKGKKIGILGLTFKAGTDDIRESPSISIIKELLIEQAELNLYDPMGMPQAKKLFPHLSFAANGQEVIDNVEIVLILTEWPEFADLNYGDITVIDGKNLSITKKPKNYQGLCW